VLEAGRNAPKDKALIISTFSGSGSDVMLNILDSAFRQSDRLLDAVFSGHVHNYQRFTRQIDKHEIPYIVVGTEGHSKLHKMQKHDSEPIRAPFKLPDRNDVLLQNYDRYGFMRLSVTANRIKGKFHSAGAPHNLLDRSTFRKIDEFELDLKKHKLIG
jgi:hypothetical protein